MSIYATTHSIDNPIIYRGSHIVPSWDDSVGGAVDIGTIPDHIDAPDPVMRLTVCEDSTHTTVATVLLTPEQVRGLRDVFTGWLEGTDQ